MVLGPVTLDFLARSSDIQYSINKTDVDTVHRGLFNMNYQKLPQICISIKDI